MKKAFIVLVAVLLVSGCVVVPADTAGKACALLNIATMEADLSPVWHDKAGDVLVACGIKDAAEVAAQRACEAQKRAGLECDEVTP